jgi:sulfur-oxidizing protein SoxX
MVASMKLTRLPTVSFLALAAASCATQPPAPTASDVQRVLDQAYVTATPEQKRRSVQDEPQAICSRQAAGQQLRGAEVQKVVEASRGSIKYPDSGKLMGDWKVGQRLALDGYGMRLLPRGGGDVTPNRPNGANCYACHQLDPKEVNAGNLGASLTGFGTARGNAPDVQKYVYEKVYNAWAFFPCSTMPRMGANGFLTPEQIADVVAFVLDPESPVNKR